MTWMLEHASAQSHGVRLRELLDSREPLSVPGVFNPLTAMIARKVGFDALYFLRRCILSGPRDTGHRPVHSRRAYGRGALDGAGFKAAVHRGC